MASAPPPPYHDHPLTTLTTPRQRLLLQGETRTNSFIQEASHLVLSHNAFIRGFNTIYQHAPTVTSTAYPSFVRYCLAWHDVVHAHHVFQKTRLFPIIELYIGHEGVMADAPQQQQQVSTFTAGLERFKMYLQSLANPAENFNPLVLLQIMESFQEPLHRYLVELPDRLLGLARFSTHERPLDLHRMVAQAGSPYASGMGPMFNTLPVFFLNMDLVVFEEGMWLQSWPPVSGFMRFVVMKLAPAWQGRIWRYSCCDGDNRRRVEYRRE